LTLHPIADKHTTMRIALLTFGLVTGLPLLGSAANLLHTFEKIQATDQFWAEGAHVGDFNHDGKVDVVSGVFWYEGPDFKVRHEIWPAKASFQRKKSDGTTETVPGFEGALGVNNAYSDCFLTYTYDFNGDGWVDVIVYGHPGTEVAWYENPKNAPGFWKKHVVFDVLDNESPEFADVTGDGKPELVCCSKGYLGYVEVDWKNPTDTWKFHPVTPKGDYQRYTHGIGYGDINGDGRVDLLDKDAWFEHPASHDDATPWKRHPFPFAKAAAQMLVYDVNGDGLNDVITAHSAHEFGLSWFEQVREKGEISFREHVILNKDNSKNAYGVQFSQVHALDLADMDGDGLKDIITGKRFWAHGKGGPDPESDGAPAVLYWFKLVRSKNHEAQFIPYLVDADSGVGTQVLAAKVSNKKYPDIIVGNKKGVFIFKHNVKKVSKAEWEQAQPRPVGN
jgi:hypothetical protein